MAIDRGGSTRGKGIPKKPKQNKPKKKKQNTPKPNIPSSYKPTKKASASLPKAVKPKSEVKKEYNSFKNSSFKPTVTNTSNKTMREQAQIGFKAYQKAKNENVVGTQKPSNISNNITDSFKVKENEYAKALKKGKSVNKRTVGTQKPDKTDNPFTDWSKPFDKGYSLEKDYKKAAKKGLKTTYLGTEQKKTETKISGSLTGKDNQNLRPNAEERKQTAAQASEYYKSKEWVTTKGELKKANKKEWRKYLKDELGWSKEQINEWMDSDEGKRYRRDSYNEMKDALKDDINKEISKGVVKSNTLKSVNALTQQEFQQMENATRLGKDLGNKYLDSVDKKLAEKIGSKTVEAGLRSKGAYGVMQGMSKADIWSGSVGRYNEAARTGMEQVKDSGSYMLGYGVGLAADMGMGGVASRGASLSKGIPKVAAQLAGKGVPEKAAVEVADEVAKLTRAEGTKLFFKNRTGELAAELPTNVLDATKMSLDADGNLDKKSFRNWLIINNAFTFGMGGLMEGVGAKITKDLANETSELIAKKQAGTISKEEVDKLAENIQKISKKTRNENSLSGAIARDVKNEADAFDQAVKDARLQRKLDKANARTERKARLEEENRVREAEAKAKAREEELNTAYKNYDPEYLEKENIDLNRQIRKIDNKTKKLKGQAKNSRTLEGHERIGAKQRELAKEREGLEQALKENEGKLKNIEHSKTTTASARELNNRLKEIFKEKKVAGTHEKYQRLANEEKAIKERLQQIQDLHKTAMKTEELIAKQQAGTLTEAEAKELNKNVRYLKNRKGREAGLDIEVPKPKTLKERYDDANLPFWMEQHSPQSIKESIKELEDVIPDLEKAVKETLNEQRKAFARGNQQEGFRLSKEYNRLKEELEATRDDIISFKKADEINEKFGGAEIKTEAPKVPESAEIPTKIKNTPEPNPEAVKEADEVFGDQTVGKTPKKKQTYEDLQNSSNSLNAKDRQKVETKGKEVEKKVKKNNEEKWKFWKWFQGAFVSELRPLEEIAMQSERADLRKRGRVTINKLLTAKAKSREMIQSRGVKMFVERNLHKDVDKANFYDTYVLLKHDLDRVKQKVITARTKDGDIINIDFGRELATKKMPNGEWKKIDFKPFKDHEGVKWDFNNMNVDTINDFLKKNDLDIDGKIRDKSMSGMTVEEIESVLKNMETNPPVKAWGKDVQEFQKELVDYHHELLKIDAESGIIPKEGIDGLEGLEKRYKNYVPSFREGDSDLLVNELPIEKNYFGTTIDTASSLKDIKGGTTLNGIFPMYTQMVVKTEKVMKRAAENDMFNVIAQINGVKPEQLPRGHTPSELLEVSSGVYKSQKSGTYKVYFRQNGKGVSMDISEDVYHAIRKWSGEERAAIMEFKIGKALSDPKLQVAASTFKAFITDYSLIFGARNFFRDTATALVYSERPLQWIAAFPKAVMSLSGKGKYGKAFQQYVKDGGRYSALVTSTDLSKAIKPGKKEGIPGLRYIKEFNTALETLPRMSEYIASVERLGKAKNLDWEKALENTKITDEALYNAKEVTLNFDRAGEYGRLLNKGLVPFFNPSIQGIDKLRRVLYADNKSRREFIGMMGKISGGAIIPAAAWELIVGDDEDYQKLSAYNKYTYFCIPIPPSLRGEDPTYLKIPRAREMAALQMPIEWVFQNIKYGSRDGEANLFESFKRSFSMNPMHPGLAYEQIGPVNPLTDNYFSPFINLLRNKDWMGYNIEGYTDKEKRNEERINDIYDTETSTLAVMLQSWTNDHVDSALKFFGIDGEAGEWIRKHKVSPKQLDSMMDSYMGVIYDMGIRPFSLKGASLKEGKENPKDFFTQWASSTFGSSFIVNGTLSSSRRTEMYAKIDNYNKKLESLPEGSDEYNEVNYKLTQLKNNVTYDVQALDFAIDGINRNKKLTQKQKAYLTNAIKREQNGIIDDYNDGKKHQKDPLKYLLELKDKDGKKVFTTEEVINNFTYTNEKNGKNTIRDSYDLLKESDYYKKHPKKATREFLDITFSTREVASKCGDSKTFVDYETMAVVCTDKANKTGKSYQEIIDAYHIGKKQMKMADVYINQMGGDTDTYTASHRHIVEGAGKLGLFPKDLQSHDYAMILANAKTKNGNRLKDRAYWIENPDKNGTYSYAYQRMNPARCLSSEKYKESNWTYKKVHKFASKYGLDWNSPDKKIEDAINKRYPNKTREEKAALFEVIKPTDDNPFGKIGDYSEDGDAGYHGGSGSGSGRGRKKGHGHGGGGGSGSSNTFTPLINTAGKKAKVSNTSKKSNLDNAYRKKLKKLREETRKNKLK